VTYMQLLTGPASSIGDTLLHLPSTSSKLMRKIFFGFACMLLLCEVASSQDQFAVSTDKNGSKVLKGILTREALEKDTAFKWFSENQKGYTPNSLALSALKQYKDSIRIIAFMGTWCEDSHVILPKFFSLLDATSFSKDRVSILGTDRDKKTLGHLSESLNVMHVPTLIVMKNGKELGRVVEYGKYGMWDKELGEVINSGFTSTK